MKANKPIKPFSKQFLIKLFRDVIISIIVSFTASVLIDFNNIDFEIYNSPTCGGNTYSITPVLLLFIFGLISAITYLLFTIKQRISDVIINKLAQNKNIHWVLLLFGILCVVFALPTLILLMLKVPTEHKRAIQTFVLFISIGFAVLCYNKEKLPTLADKVTYFSGIILTPVGIVSILLT